MPKRVECDSLLGAVQAQRETKAQSAHSAHGVCRPAGSLGLGIGKHGCLHVHIAEDVQHVRGRKCSVTLFRHKCAQLFLTDAELLLSDLELWVLFLADFTLFFFSFKTFHNYCAQRSLTV